MKWHNLSQCWQRISERSCPVFETCTSSDYLVISISKIPLKQEQVSDIKSKACLCIGRTRLSSAHKAVCWLITKCLSLYALQPQQASLTRNNRDICPGPVNTRSVRLPGHLPLFFFLKQWIGFYYTKHSSGVSSHSLAWLGKKVATIIWNVISLWFLERE